MTDNQNTVTGEIMMWSKLCDNYQKIKNKKLLGYIAHRNWNAYQKWYLSGLRSVVIITENTEYISYLYYAKDNVQTNISRFQSLIWGLP